MWQLFTKPALKSYKSKTVLGCAIKSIRCRICHRNAGLESESFSASFFAQHRDENFIAARILPPSRYFVILLTFPSLSVVARSWRENTTDVWRKNLASYVGGGGRKMRIAEGENSVCGEWACSIRTTTDARLRSSVCFAHRFSRKMWCKRAALCPLKIFSLI